VDLLPSQAWVNKAAAHQNPSKYWRVKMLLDK